MSNYDKMIAMLLEMELSRLVGLVEYTQKQELTPAVVTAKIAMENELMRRSPETFVRWTEDRREALAQRREALSPRTFFFV